MYDTLVFRTFAEWLKARKMRVQFFRRCFVTAYVGVVTNLIEIFWGKHNLTSIIRDESEPLGGLYCSIVNYIYQMISLNRLT
jgi:hypothetical protein